MTISYEPVHAELTIGSKAPPLNIEFWLSKNDLPKVKSFEPKKVYVVEFWATWCPPCVASMPHLAKLQGEFKSKGVQIISISDEELNTVEKFLDRVERPKKDSNEQQRTFRELTSVYSLTTDPDQSVYKDYMESSGQAGIPSAFIVGKEGLIEWIGHPMQMDEPLQQIVEDKWIRAEYLKKREQQKKFELAIEEIFAAQQSGRHEQAVKQLDGLIAGSEDAEIKYALVKFKIQLMMESNPAEAAKLMTELVANVDDVEELKGLAWQVVEIAETDSQAVPKPLVQAALSAAEKAAKKAPKNGLAQDTLAHLLFLNGDIDKAIELQKKAIELSPDVESLKSFLDRLEKSKSK